MTGAGGEGGPRGIFLFILKDRYTHQIQLLFNKRRRGQGESSYSRLTHISADFQGDTSELQKQLVFKFLLRFPSAITCYLFRLEKLPTPNNLQWYKTDIINYLKK